MTSYLIATKRILSKKVTNTIIHTTHNITNCSAHTGNFETHLLVYIFSGTREKRKNDKVRGVKRNVEDREQKIGNWEKFIILDSDKASLVNFLCSEVSQQYCSAPRKELILGGGFSDVHEVWSSCADTDVASLSASHEEADTRILLHARNAAAAGYQQVNVVSRDTDVLVLLVAHLPMLCQYVWMFAGTSTKRYYIAVHKIVISEMKRNSLLAFHALTGCDTTSQFVGIGKVTAWKIFESCPELLQHLGEVHHVPDEVLSSAEVFVCKLYDKGIYAYCTF